MITVDQIYAKIIENESSKQNFYRWLGASLIGSECTRYVALKFYCAFDENFSGRILRVFENGHQAEPRIIHDLELAGGKVHHQQMMIDAPECLGHAGSTIDGLIDIDGQTLLLELKTAKDEQWKKYADPEKHLKETNIRYYAQVQVNMHLTQTQKALWCCENKDTNELYIEYIDYNCADAQKYLALMGQVVGGYCGEKISEISSFYKCKMCGARDVCHGKKLPRVHCLTCANSQAIAGGKFKCVRWDKEIPSEHLCNACGEHVFNPNFIPLELVNYGEYYCTYRLSNGKLLCNCAVESFPKLCDGEMQEVLISTDWAKKENPYE